MFETDNREIPGGMSVKDKVVPAFHDAVIILTI
jgi:hypothetical protein